MNADEGKPDLSKQVAGNNIDSIEAGGGIWDWTEIDGRIFLTRRWMVEIGEITKDYSTYDFQNALAKAMQKQLVAEGFKLTPPQFKLPSVRYQRGKTVGRVEVLSFFLNSGNLPLRMEFIFNESYLRSPRRKAKSYLVRLQREVPEVAGNWGNHR